jgi:signal transduction histidine kinase
MSSVPRKKVTPITEGGGGRPPKSFAEQIAEGIHAAHVDLAAEWLTRLQEILAVPARSAFPTTSLLDHIPDLIQDIARDLAKPAEQALVANTSVMAKAQELGNLRFRQQASVHQLLREYRLLADVINAFVASEVDRLGLQAHSAEALRVAARLHESVFVLMQTTIDTFVARYAEKTARQTAQLEGFNRTVTHELRQPLGTIVSAVGVLRRHDAPAGARARCLDLIDTNSRRMAALTTKLLTLSSLDSDSPQIQETDLARLAHDTAKQLGEMAERRRVEMRVLVPAIRIVADVARVELVLVNLISNAIKYFDPAKRDRFVEIAASPQGERVLLSVRDNGLGIPREDLDRVFDSFYRAHSARDDELEADGIGLGLAIVAECVRYLGATISIDSEVGSGTTVSLSLPSTPPAETPAS